MIKYKTILFGGLAFFGVNIILDFLFSDKIDIKGTIIVTVVYFILSLIIEVCKNIKK